MAYRSSKRMESSSVLRPSWNRATTRARGNHQTALTASQIAKAGRVGFYPQRHLAIAKRLYLVDQPMRSPLERDARWADSSLETKSPRGQRAASGEGPSGTAPGRYP